MGAISRLRNGSKILIVIALTLIAQFVGCSANQSDRSRLERAKNMLDQHEYGKAIESLEKQYSESPNNKSVAVLLAQAHLGASGVELFEFISKVFGDQGPAENLDLVLIPECDEGEISKPQGFDFRCIAIRILRRLPNPDNEHLERARSILRQSFPIPSKTSTDVNFLAAFIELGSGFGRLKVLLNKTLINEIREKSSITPSELPFQVVIHHLKRLFTEIMQGVVRAKYSYGKVNKFVVAYEGKPLIKIGESELVFNEDLNMPAVIRFALSVLHENSNSIDRELNEFVSENVSRFGHGIIRVLHTLDNVHFSGAGTETIELMFQFERLISRTLKAFQLEGSKANFDIFSIVWTNPPAILKNLFESAAKSWNEESSEPLKKYFVSTKDQWNELNRIMADWEEWVNIKLSKKQREQILTYLRDVQTREKDIFTLPTNLDLDHTIEWQNRFVSKMEQEMLNILNGKVESVPEIDPENARTGLELLKKSKKWIESNLWVIQL